MIGKVFKSNLSVLLIVVAAVMLLGFASVYVFSFQPAPIRSDGVGYYAYLPSIFVYHDLSMKSLPNEYKEPNMYAGIKYLGETGKYLDKYPIGEAIMILPFFLIGHTLTLILSNYLNLRVDGFSTAYQITAGLAGTTYMIWGIFILKKLLDKYFTSLIVTLTLMLIIFATNLFHYGTYDSIFSHAFSFFLFSSFLYTVNNWYENINVQKSILLGIISGLIILVRPTNIIFLIFFPFWNIRVSSFKEQFNARINLYLNNKRKICYTCLFILVLVALQLAYWKYITGNWLIYSYAGEHFNFLHPEIVNVLFSVRKGLLFWSPILIFSIIGLFINRSKLNILFLPSILYLGANLYIISSWWSWPYGGSYGHRAFVESYALLSFPLAAFYEAVLNNRKNIIKYFVLILTIMFASISIITMIQYWRGEIPYDKTTWDLYKRAITFNYLYDPALPDGGYVALISFPVNKIIAKDKIVNVPVILKNNGSADWSKDIGKTGKYTFNLSYRWLTFDQKQLSGFDSRISLPNDMHPGDTANYNLSIAVPDKKGTYFLEFDLVHENVTFFHLKGSPTALLKVIVL